MAWSVEEARLWEMIVEGFDLTGLIDKLRTYRFERIVLQFPDDYLNSCNAF